jgi:hypothetical protein
MDGTVPPNPADRPLVTLDNNALIALRENEPTAAVQQLLALNRAGVIVVTVSQNTALEQQRVGEERDLQAQRAWLMEQGIAPENIFTAGRSIGFETPDAPGIPTFDPDLDAAAMRRVQAILAPDVPFLWRDYRNQQCRSFAKAKGASEELTRIYLGAPAELDRLRYSTWIPPRPTPALDALSAADREELRALSAQWHRFWMNWKHDALCLNNHLTRAWHTTHPERAIFVTSDGNFHKRMKLAALRELGYRGHVLRPTAAVAYLRTFARMPTAAE